MVINVMTSSLSSTCTFCLNNLWNVLSVILPKIQRARTHRQQVFMSPERWNWVLLCVKVLPNNRWKILGSLCVTAISCPGANPMLEKYSTGCPEARALITTKCPGALTSFERLLLKEVCKHYSRKKLITHSPTKCWKHYSLHGVASQNTTPLKT